MNINFNVVWCDLGREAALTSSTSCSQKLLWASAGPIGKNAFCWGYPGVQRSRVDQVSHEMWFYS